MIENIENADKLRGLARSRVQEYETQTVNKLLVHEYLAKGWLFDKKNNKTIRLKRAKAHGAFLEDRVWSLLYKMNFM